jgi:CheY-like chemotaxis protein
LAPRRVLIVDDEPLIAMMLQDRIEQPGYEPLGPAASVAQALALIETSAPAAAVLDLSLRGEDSYPVADALTERKIPFVFGTGRERVAEGYAHVPLLNKPYDLKALQAALTSLHAWRQAKLRP